jgi:hypothetical protein
MPLLFGLEASQLILGAIVAAVGALAFWLVGHTVEKDLNAVGGNITHPLTDVFKNVGFLIAAVVGIFLITKLRRK